MIAHGKSVIGVRVGGYADGVISVGWGTAEAVTGPKQLVNNNTTIDKRKNPFTFMCLKSIMLCYVGSRQLYNDGLGNIRLEHGREQAPEILHPDSVIYWIDVPDYTLRGFI